MKSHRIIYTLLDDIKALLEAGPEEEDKEEQEEERGTAKIMSVIEIKANKTCNIKFINFSYLHL